MRFQWWPTVLLERDSHLENNCSVIERKYIFFKGTFLQISTFFQLFFVVARKKLGSEAKKQLSNLQIPDFEQTRDLFAFFQFVSILLKRFLANFILDSLYKN